MGCGPWLSRGGCLGQRHHALVGGGVPSGNAARANIGWAAGGGPSRGFPEQGVGGGLSRLRRRGSAGWFMRRSGEVGPRGGVFITKVMDRLTRSAIEEGVRLFHIDFRRASECRGWHSVWRACRQGCAADHGRARNGIGTMAGLLSLYQQDVASSEPILATPARAVVDWVDGCKDYLDRLREKYGRTDGVSVRQKRLAAGCLNLAAQSLRLGTAVSAGLADKAVDSERPVGRVGTRSFAVFVVAMFAAVVLNIWLLDATAAISGFRVAGVVRYPALERCRGLAGWLALGRHIPQA